MSDSIAVVVLDSVRYDKFCSYFNWIEGQHYDQVYSTSHWTIPSHASLLTGLMPRETGTYAGSPSFKLPQNSIINQLNKEGYKTRLFTANIQLLQWDGWTDNFDDIFGPTEIDNLFNWSKAVNLCKSPSFLKYPESIIRCITSDCNTRKSLRDGWNKFWGNNTQWTTSKIIKNFKNLEGDASEEFVLFNLMDAHSTSGKNTGESIAKGVSNPDRLENNYEKSIDEMSNSYKELFDILYDKFDWVITLSDHGELLGEYDLAGHGYGIYPELVKIPLVISGSKSDSLRSRDELTSIMDITATIRDIVGIENKSRGISLLSSKKRHISQVERLGQPHLHEDMFKRLNIYDKFSKYDTPLRGVAINKNGYAYETLSEIKVTDDWSKNAPEEIKEAFEGIDFYKENDSETEEVSENVRDLLEDLGYA